MENIIEEIKDPNNKFDTCKFRSKEKKSIVVKRCACQGGDYVDEHYSCDEREIQRLSPDICERCIIYQPEP